MSIKKVLIKVCIILLVFLYPACKKPTPTGFSSKVIDVSQEPYQGELEEGEVQFQLELDGDQFSVIPRAWYRIAAKVKGKEGYSRGWQAKLAPVDLALVWGKLATESADRFISYSQRNRWYFYKYTPNCPYKNQYIIRHSSNNHIIPASENIRLAFNIVEADDLVVLEGFLVDVEGFKKGKKYWWRSSLTRGDTGNHSCELIYVKKFRLNDHIYE